METMKKLFALLFLLAVYMPARGEILIYQKTIRGFDCNSLNDDWDVVERHNRGYLVLEIEYEYVEEVKIINVLNAKQIDYFNEDDNKLKSMSLRLKEPILMENSCGFLQKQL